ncbi:MAG TPA: WYL domain-containing protein [Chitinivibrionales bacterium]|jgi:predicted DNA-binding transcriptional regulator YafY|nr:WYL domain-containing protein [Chitinivibrionales bacterium]
MGKETETPRGERLVTIFGHLVRNKSRKYSVQEILDVLNEDESVSLRNVQRDLKALTEIHGIPVQCEVVNGKKQYSIEPDMRSKFSLPLHKNGLLAYFLLKRLQPFFAPTAKTINELTEAVLDRVAEADYDLFEDLDEKLEETTFLLGEQSTLTLDGGMFDALLTSLTKHRKLKILYSGASYDKPKEKTVCPAKLVLFKGELYFVCTSEADPKWDFFVKLCRILKAELTEESFAPDKKRIERIEKRLVSSFGIHDDPEPKARKIVIRFPADNYYARIFSERKYHHSQKLSKDKSGRLILTLNVPVGFDLVNWVLAWPEAEAVGPEELREELRNVGRELGRKYGK